jgi:hypothetical protein
MWTGYSLLASEAGRSRTLAAVVSVGKSELAPVGVAAANNEEQSSETAQYASRDQNRHALNCPALFTNLFYRRLMGML